MKKPPLHLFLVLLFLIFGSTSASAQNRVAIRVAVETTIEKDQIELGDIAKFNVDVINAERLKTVSLGYAPNAGATKEITKERIALAIAAAGFAAHEITLNCPPKILIRRAAQQINVELLRAAVEQAIIAQFQGEKVTLKIVGFKLPQNVELQSGNISVKADVGNVRNFFLPFAAPLEISVDNRVVRRLFANVQIEATADVLVASRNLVAREKISANDFQLEPRRLQKPLQNYLRNGVNLRGAVLNKNLAAGSELTIDTIAAGIAVKNGDQVRIVGQSGKLQISIAGEARASGRIGDRIAVKNLQSGAVLQATIVDEGLVKVSF